LPDVLYKLVHLALSKQVNGTHRQLRLSDREVSSNHQSGFAVALDVSAAPRSVVAAVSVVSAAFQCALAVL
jgi:hypothetical protein